MYLLLFTNISHFFYAPLLPTSRLVCMFHFYCFILLTLCLLLAAATKTSQEDGEDNTPGAAPDPQQARRIHEEPHGT